MSRKGKRRTEQMPARKYIARNDDPFARNDDPFARNDDPFNSSSFTAGWLLAVLLLYVFVVAGIFSTNSLP